MMFARTRRHLYASWTVLNFVTAFSVYAQTDGVVAAPANDLCRDAIIVTDGNTNFSTVGAGTDGVEEFTSDCFVSAYANIDHDIWYRYTASCSGELKVNLCNSNYDTKVAVYLGWNCPASSPPLGCNDDSPNGTCAPQSELSVPVQQGSNYMIRVGGYVNQEGSGVMNLSCSPVVLQGACCNTFGSCLGTMSQADCDSIGGSWNSGQNCSSFVCPIPPPSNDNCASCISLTTGATYDGTTVGATGNSTVCGTGDTKDVWHCWTATCTGRVRMSTCGSSFDTTLAVYDACDGTQQECNDDGCTAAGQFTRSLVQLDVVSGTTYFIRVAGRNGAVGPYKVLVESCRNACCINGGFSCQTILAAQCTSGGGTLGAPGSVCAGDANFNGIDDSCETSCPSAVIATATPTSGTVDARQPHPMNSPSLRQGIGAPGSAGVTAEPISIQLNPPVTGAESCFSLCETAPDPVGPNGIGSVEYQGSGVYRIFLNHAIAMGAVTTIQYTGGGSFVHYTSHPGNTNGNSAAAPTDILDLIDHLNGIRNPPLTIYQCDFNRSAVCSPTDIITLIDLLNGAGGFDVWNGTSKATNSTCP